MPLSLSFENIFGMQDDFCMYASIVKIVHPKEFIVFNANGDILGITKEIFKNIFTSVSKDHSDASF